MPLTHDLRPHDRKLVHYVLGLLPDDEAEGLDQASIADDEVAAVLRRVEDDLVDAYVSGTLDRETRNQFEARYLASPRRREKVKFAKRFMSAVDRAAVTTTRCGTAEDHSARVRVFPGHLQGARTTPGRRRISWPLLVTAASLVLVCGVVFKLQRRENMRPAGREQAAQEHHPSPSTRQLGGARAANGKATPEPELTRNHLVGQEQPAHGGGSTRTRTLSLVQATVLVLAPQTRSIGSLPTVDIESASDPVGFELQLESRDYSRYRATLKDAGTNDVVWRSAELDSRSAPTPAVSVAVPARVLTSPHYSFEVAGLDDAKRETTVSSYAFHVDRR